MSKLCGNPDCHASSFEDIPTFGSGELDEYGFWDKPCSICARKYEKLTGEIAWPYAKDSHLKGETL